MAKGFKHGAGGGTSLNFKIVGGTSAPSNPKENTIWVNTDYPITSWQFGSEYKSKNLLKNTASSKTASGVTFTVNSDGSITANGTATADVYVEIPIVLESGKSFIISGCPNGGSASTYEFFILDNTSWTYWIRDFGGKPEFNTNTYTSFVVRALVHSGYRASNLTFYPMIRLASEKDDTYVPYGGAGNGAVWICTGTASSVEFNALKKNGLYVHPVPAKQFVGGVWVSKVSKIYQQGSWKTMEQVIVPNTDAVWTSEGVSVSKSDFSTSLIHTSVTNVHGSEGNSVSYTEFDATGYNTLYIKGSHTVNNISDSVNDFTIALTDGANTVISYLYTKTLDPKTDGGTTNFEKSLDISALSGTFRIRCRTRAWDSDPAVTHYVTITDCRLY